MFFKAKSYLLFLLKSFHQSSKNLVFSKHLIEQCFKTKPSKIIIEQTIKYKQDLLSNKNTIKVTDFGAGSKIFKSNTRQVLKIAKHAGISNKRAFFLCNLASYLNSKTILEIGTSLGIATSALSIGNKTTKITTLEGCPETAKIAQEQFDKFNLKNIHLIIGDFKDTLPKSIKSVNYDFIYFDGNHQKKATLKYFNLCLQYINKNSVFIFDDIHWSKEMEEAWKEIKQHPKITLAIDTFQWGIVFFRKDLKKEELVIRV